ncbi:MAG TPA: hypothetical protein VHD37_02540 [Candidatus Paceibacterota bacterium]|jgi:hypothetical protein|nr:hypothetical protein [Candidatus Paceibacterota bacterium]
MNRVEQRGTRLRREIAARAIRLDLDREMMAEIRTRPLDVQRAIVGMADDVLQFFRSKKHQTLQ